MQIIRDAANSAATAVGGIAHIDEDLLAEIAALNEFPVPITGKRGMTTRSLPC
jgi:glycyl-tRNA synthetase beta chain